MVKVLGDFVNLHPWYTLAIMLIPWCWGVSHWLVLLWTAYWRNLWKGMDEEKRYEYVKTAKW